MVLAGAGFVAAAWFWWPWCARDELANWPRHGVRVWTSSSNRWDRRTCRGACSNWPQRRVALPGFRAKYALVVSVFGLAAINAHDGFLARGTEVFLILLLPVLHTTVVREADALCARWTSGWPSQ